MFLSVLTRPFGMLLGLCVAMTVMTFVDKLLVGLFSLFIVDVDTNTDYTDIPLVAMLAYIFILSATRTTFVHKIFGLISYLPDVMVGWIGNGGKSLSDAQDEQKVSNIVQGSSGHLALASQSTNNAVNQIANRKAQKAQIKQGQMREDQDKARHAEQMGALNKIADGFNNQRANADQSGANKASKNDGGF